MNHSLITLYTINRLFLPSVACSSKQQTWDNFQINAIYRNNFPWLYMYKLLMGWDGGYVMYLNEYKKQEAEVPTGSVNIVPAGSVNIVSAGSVNIIPADSVNIVSTGSVNIVPADSVNSVPTDSVTIIPADSVNLYDLSLLIHKTSSWFTSFSNQWCIDLFFHLRIQQFSIQNTDATFC